jgi:hypothetical protein
MPIPGPLGRVSVNQQEIIDYIRSIYNGEVRINDDILGMEVSIYIPEKKFAIDYNTLFYNSEKLGRGRNFHHQRSVYCKERGVFLFQVFEDTWNEKKILFVP